jgi:rRNA maturation RNase YbeY
MPLLELFNRQRKKRVNLFEFRIFAEFAMEQVTKRFMGTLPGEINAIFVSDARIAEIHRDFLSLDGPTDVITFQHGEIVMSVETAERQAEKFATSFDHELRLYFVHGLLHLAGLDDVTVAGRKTMAKLQEQIVRKLPVVGCQLSVGKTRKK